MLDLPVANTAILAMSQQPKDQERKIWFQAGLAQCIYDLMQGSMLDAIQDLLACSPEPDTPGPGQGGSYDLDASVPSTTTAPGGGGGSTTAESDMAETSPTIAAEGETSDSNIPTLEVVIEGIDKKKRQSPDDVEGDREHTTKRRKRTSADANRSFLQVTFNRGSTAGFQ